jgi:hypothetical protein
MPCPSRKAVCLPDLIAGETGQWEITITDQDDVPVNVTGASIEFRVTARGLVVASLTSSPQLQVTDAVNGKVLATLATATLEPWQYDVHLITTDTGGRKHITPALVRILPQPTSNP